MKLADSNDAPRQKITIEKPKPASFNGKVEIKCDSDKVEIYDAVSGGTKLTLPVEFPAASLPKDLFVQGVTESDSMRDVKISISAAGKELDSVKFTVLWVEKPVMSFSGQLSAHNAKRNNYKNWTKTKNFDLKLQEYDDRWGVGTQAAGKVHPAKFKFAGSALKLERDNNFAYFNGSTQTLSQGFRATIPPGQDTGPDWARDDLPPTIFDFDAPGVSNRDVYPASTIIRMRGNYKAFASVHVQGKDVRCSEVTEYFVVISMKQTGAPSGNTYTQENGVAGDNKAAEGTTKTTWDLK